MVTNRHLQETELLKDGDYNSASAQLIQSMVAPQLALPCIHCTTVAQSQFINLNLHASSKCQHSHIPLVCYFKKYACLPGMVGGWSKRIKQSILRNQFNILLSVETAFSRACFCFRHHKSQTSSRASVIVTK
jgi:hypothetical protein